MISDYELFLYVYYPDSIESDKKTYIENHSDLFEAELELLRANKEALEKPLPEQLLNRTVDKIMEQNRIGAVTLHRIESSSKKTNNSLTLAAHSNQLNGSDLQVLTFIDDEKTCLAKCIKNGINADIHLFDANGNRITNYTIEFEDGTSLSADSQECPFEIVAAQKNISILPR